MTCPAPVAALPGRLAPIMAALRAAVAKRMTAFPALAPLLQLAWSRLHRLERRFACLARRAGAPPRPSARPSDPRLSGARLCGARPSGERLPAGFAWLVRLVPEAACHGGQLRHLLSEPDMGAFLAAAPGAGRVLRPLCRMLGVAPGPALTPPVAEESARTRGASGGGRRIDAPGAVQVRRSRIPRSPGLAWLRWRSAGLAS